MVREAVGALAGFFLILGAGGAKAAEPARPSPPAAKAAPAAEPAIPGVVLEDAAEEPEPAVEQRPLVNRVFPRGVPEETGDERALTNRVFPEGVPDLEETAEQYLGAPDDFDEGLPGQEPAEAGAGPRVQGREGGQPPPCPYKHGDPAMRGHGDKAMRGRGHPPVPGWAYGLRPGVFGLGGAGGAPVPYFVGDGNESLLDGESTYRRWDTDPRFPELEDLEYQP